MAFIPDTSVKSSRKGNPYWQHSQLIPLFFVCAATEFTLCPSSLYHSTTEYQLPGKFTLCGIVYDVITVITATLMLLTNSVHIPYLYSYSSSVSVSSFSMHSSVSVPSLSFASGTILHILCDFSQLVIFTDPSFPSFSSCPCCSKSFTGSPVVPKYIEGASCSRSARVMVIGRSCSEKRWEIRLEIQWHAGEVDVGA